MTDNEPKSFGPLALLGGVVILLAVGLLVFGPLPGSGAEQEQASSPEEWARQAAGGPTSDSGIPRRKVRGAPLDDGASGSSTRATGGGSGRPIRNIPLHSFDLIRRLESEIQTDDNGRPTFEPASDGKHLKVPFRALSGFPYRTPRARDFAGGRVTPEAVQNQIPDYILDLDGKRVLVLGFMVPVKFDRTGKIESFIITQNQMFCCYGVVPAMNEWITVDMEEGKHTRYRANVPVGLRGILAVGEEIQDGYVTSVYRLEASDVLSIEEVERLIRD